MHSITVSDAEHVEMKGGARRILNEYLQHGQIPNDEPMVLALCLWVLRDELLTAQQMDTPREHRE